MMQEAELKEMLKAFEQLQWATKNPCVFCDMAGKVSLLRRILGLQVHEERDRVGEDFSRTVAYCSEHGIFISQLVDGKCPTCGKQLQPKTVVDDSTSKGSE